VGEIGLNISCVVERHDMSARSLLPGLIFFLTENAVAKQAPTGGYGKLACMV
jgi:hypothetical protein